MLIGWLQCRLAERRSFLLLAKLAL